MRIKSASTVKLHFSARKACAPLENLTTQQIYAILLCVFISLASLLQAALNFFSAALFSCSEAYFSVVALFSGKHSVSPTLSDDFACTWRRTAAFAECVTVSPSAVFGLLARTPWVGNNETELSASRSEELNNADRSAKSNDT